MSTTGLFAVVERTDERLAKYGMPLIKEKLRPLNAFDQAHCVMLLEQGIISQDAARAILTTLAKVEGLEPEGFPWAKGDLWPQKERFVIAELGEEVGGRLHTGRSRQDLSVTVDRLHLRPMVLRMAAQMNELREALLNLADANIETVMPCYTWMQTAQPTTFAHYLLATAYALARRFERIIRAYEMTNRSPAGAALQTGTSHPLNRARVAELLGFDCVIRNTRDAAMNCDYLPEIQLAAAMSVMDVVRLLEDLTIWHSAEFDFVSLSSAWCGTSSIMPQKRNPYPFMMIRSKAARLLSLASHSFSNLEGPTLGPPSPFYASEDTIVVLSEFEGIFIMTAGFMPTLTVNKQKMQANVAASWAQATDLADAIVRGCGLSFRTAHHIVAEFVSIAGEAGLSAAGADGNLLDQAAQNVIGRPLQLSAAAIKDALDPNLAVRARKVFGATSPDDVKAQIMECRAQLNHDAAQINDREKRLRKAGHMLKTAIDAILSPTSQQTRGGPARENH